MMLCLLLEIHVGLVVMIDRAFPDFLGKFFCFLLETPLMPGVHMIATVASGKQKEFSDRNDHKKTMQSPAISAGKRSLRQTLVQVYLSDRSDHMDKKKTTLSSNRCHQRDHNHSIRFRMHCELQTPSKVEEIQRYDCLCNKFSKDYKGNNCFNMVDKRLLYGRRPARGAPY